MNVVACYKIVPEEQDIVVSSNRTLNTSRAELKLGDYDLNAIEESVRIAGETGGIATLLTMGGVKIDNSKLIKAALSRGAESLQMVIDDAAEDIDAYQTAAVLAAVLMKTPYDLVICGEGSADLYAQQVGCQLGEHLGIASYNSVSKVTPGQGTVTIERTLENEVEVLEVSLPAVLAVTSDINLPRIPQLKDILAAGKKEAIKYTLTSLGISPVGGVETVSTLAPEKVDRKLVILDGATQENIDSFVQSLNKEV
jgi:electron transfer flavoprotein beta subunit